MTDNAEETPNNNTIPAAQEEEPKYPKMAAATDEQPPPQTLSNVTKISEKMSTMTFSIWPPTQRTRDAVVKRLVETLTTPSSVLSKRYGTMPADEAADAARRIEDEAFGAAAASANGADNADDGIEVLQVYSKEISKRMLDAVKSRSVTTGSAAPGGNNGVSQQAPDVVAPASGEEISAVETEA